ncbi:MAG: CehA/McbA family metallohydrolase, partial [Chloroflexi bacterium]|nr:CehA/McbA family metallohydrolase [Chloroflexota bacterium]
MSCHRNCISKFVRGLIPFFIVGVLISSLVFCPYSGANAGQEPDQVSSNVDTIPVPTELGSPQTESSTETTTKTNEMIHGESSTGNLMLLVPKQVETYRVPPIEVWVPITILALANPTKLESIKATIQGGESITQVTTDLIPVNRSVAEVLSATQDPESTSFADLMEKTYQTTLKIDVSSMNLKEGSIIPISMEVISSPGSGLAERIQTQIEYSVLALPQVTNWYGGDHHVHTTWSIADHADTLANDHDIDTAVAWAKTVLGFKWIGITDHAQALQHPSILYPERSWSSYVDTCNQAMDKYGIPVLTGAEFSTNFGGHLIGYNMNLNADTIPEDNQSILHQDLINQVTATNPPNSFAVIAHPYSKNPAPLPSYPWTNWDVSNIGGMELMTDETTVKQDTINTWFSLLNRGLPATLNENARFVVGVGCSDYHFWPQELGKAFTWVYMPSPIQPSNPNNIWDAIRAGRVSASGRGDLGFFTLDGSEQGSVVTVNQGDTLTFMISQEAVTNRRCKSITIYGKEGNVVRSFSEPIAKTVSCTTTVSGDNFYVVGFEFWDGTALSLGEVWANPIFVKVNPTPQPSLVVSPSEINFGATQTSLQVTVKNNGSGILNWNASKAAAWITLSKSAGSLTAGQSEQVTVTVNRSGKAPGPYQGTISFSGNGGSGSVIVNMTVPTPSSVTLTLYVHENSPSGPLLSGASVTGTDGGGNAFNHTTNSSGYVTIPGAPGSWSFVASKSGYITNSWPLNITQTEVRDAFLFKQSADIIVDDLSSGFAKYGQASYWYQSSSGGYNGHFFYTRNSQSQAVNYATWTPNLSGAGAGTYLVSVYIPSNYATTTFAYYAIVHNGSTEYRSVN